MKVIDAATAAEMISDGMKVYIGGFGAYSGVDELLHGLADRYEKEGRPKGLTVLSGICSGFGNMDDIGHNIIAVPGLVGNIIAGHYNISPKMSQAITENQIGGFALPLGQICAMLRAGASGQPGVISKVGLGTYVDPEVEGCAVNDKAKLAGFGRSLVRHIDVDGEDYLFYSALRPDVCMIRGTFADEDGNVSIRREGLSEYQLETAMATKNNGGIVIVQVDELVDRGEIDPKEVRIPGMMVDYVVVGAQENSRQMYGSDKYRPEISAEAKVAQDDIEPLPLDVRKVIARRAAMELPGYGNSGSAAIGSRNSEGEVADTDDKKCVVNLGIGLPAGVGKVADEEGMAEAMILSLETGPIGGVPLDGAAFAGAINHDVVMNSADTFSFYDGGGLDMAVLGAAEIDMRGNVNVSKFGTRCAGPGGFINISQNTRDVCFVGTFMAGKQDIKVGGGKLEIVQDGENPKIVSEVQQITFSGDYACAEGQNVLFVTERAVFRLMREDAQSAEHSDSCRSGLAEIAPVRLELTEIAPGVDLEKDVLGKMDFRPHISPDIKEMDRWIFE